MPASAADSPALRSWRPYDGGYQTCEMQGLSFFVKMSSISTAISAYAPPLRPSTTHSIDRLLPVARHQSQQRSTKTAAKITLSPSEIGPPAYGHRRDWMPRTLKVHPATLENLILIISNRTLAMEELSPRYMSLSIRLIWAEKAEYFIRAFSITAYL